MKIYFVIENPFIFNGLFCFIFLKFAQKMKNRVIWIDAFKGLGIILVMLAHFHIPFIFHILFFAVGYMLWFFFLSGYVSKEENILTGIKRKAKRLLIPYFFYGLIFTLYDFIFLNKNSIWGILYSRYGLYKNNLSTDNVVTFPTYYAPSWFLTCMLVAFLWFFVYVNIHRKNNKILFLTSCILITIALDKLPILLPWSIDTSFLASFFMILGYECKRSNFFERKFSLAFYIILLLIYVLMKVWNGTVNMSIGIYGDHWPLDVVLFILMGGVSIVFFQAALEYFQNSFIIKILSAIGKQSLRLMCIHVFVITLTCEVWAKISQLPTIGIILGMTISIGICMFMSYLQKYKYFNFLKWI